MNEPLSKTEQLPSTAEIHVLAKRIARGIFACGAEPDHSVTRIQFKLGEWPNNEQSGGGLCESSLVDLIASILSRTMTTKEPTNAEIRKWLETYDYTFGTRKEIALLVLDRLEETQGEFTAAWNEAVKYKTELEAAKQEATNYKLGFATANEDKETLSHALEAAEQTIKEISDTIDGIGEVLDAHDLNHLWDEIK